jgi:hypothetical protein
MAAAHSMAAARLTAEARSMVEASLTAAEC